MPRFIEVIAKDVTFIDANKIISLVLRTELDPPCWVAMTVDLRTFHLSERMASIVLDGATRELPAAEDMDMA
jgi:hypothetical protein